MPSVTENWIPLMFLSRIKLWKRANEKCEVIFFDKAFTRNLDEFKIFRLARFQKFPTKTKCKSFLVIIYLLPRQKTNGVLKLFLWCNSYSGGCSSWRKAIKSVMGSSKRKKAVTFNFVSMNSRLKIIDALQYVLIYLDRYSKIMYFTQGSS